MNEYALLGLFFFIALFYSSIGFGGGSSYLALLSLLLTDFYEIRTMALLLNVIVVTIGTLLFIRKRIFDWSLFWPFVLVSVPMAFIGAQLRLSETTFFILLGSALILASLLLALQVLNKPPVSRSLNKIGRASLGGGIGLFSGIVGIGGGVFLSPTLNLMRWENPKTIASLASVFILVNSLAGIAGLVIRDTFLLNMDHAVRIPLAVALGGLMGSRVSVKVNLDAIRAMTALLVMYVGVRVILLNGFGINI